MGLICILPQMCYLDGRRAWTITIASSPLALNLEETYFEKPGITDDSMASLRLLHYSPEKSNIELGVYGTGAHSDYGLITLLATDDVPSLQICRDKDARPQVWEEVPPMNGAYIVNLGDMLERWSNGLFRSTLHRVINKVGVERYSRYPSSLRPIMTVGWNVFQLAVQRTLLPNINP